MSRHSVLLPCFMFLGLVGCEDTGSDDGNGAHSARCGALCEEDLCGPDESRTTCINECTAQSDGLDAPCVQCLVDDSSLSTRRLVDDGSFCSWHFEAGWTRCANDGVDCSRDPDYVEICADESLPSSCELNFGSINDCSDFCG